MKSAARFSLMVTSLAVLFGLVVTLPTQVAAQDVASLTELATYDAKTNAVGASTFPKILPGPEYQLSFSKDGFASQTISNIYVGVDATHTQNAQLKIGSTKEVVEVKGSGLQVSLDTTDTAVSSTLDMSMVHELPLAIRDNPLGLLNYSPGVTVATGGDDDTLGSRGGVINADAGPAGNAILSAVRLLSGHQLGSAFRPGIGQT